MSDKFPTNDKPSPGLDGNQPAGIKGRKNQRRPFQVVHYQSFKVYDLQADTQTIVIALSYLMPERRLNETFLQIVGEGIGRTFEMDLNDRWIEENRPILEAFFHARMILHLAVKHAKTLDKPPRELASGWAAVLYLFRLR